MTWGRTRGRTGVGDTRFDVRRPAAAADPPPHRRGTGRDQAGETTGAPAGNAEVAMAFLSPCGAVAGGGEPGALLGTSIAAGQAQAKFWFDLGGYYYVDKARADEVMRHGTTTLFAALEVATGKVTDACTDRHRHQEFLGFLQQVAAAYPRRQLHVVVDNLSTHKHPAVRA
jgi:hypothetical protein